VAYEIDGVRHDDLPMTQAEFARAEPVYESFPGWDEGISKVRSLDELPRHARDYVAALESMIGAKISAVGVGAERDEAVVIHDLLPSHIAAPPGPE
jgi:adenylosuccinate synthase